jgi:hypothetical protein
MVEEAVPVPSASLRKFIAEQISRMVEKVVKGIYHLTK